MRAWILCCVAAAVEGRHHLLQLAGDGVLAVKLRLVEDGHEDVLGEHVLDDHLAHVGHLHARVDGLLAQLQELVQRLPESRVGAELLFDDGAQLVGQGRHVGVELLDGAVELAHLARLVGDEARQQRIERGGIGKVGAQHLLAVLVQHRRVGILEEDVGGGVAIGKLGGDLGVQVVLLVLALPVAPILAQGVFERAVGDDAPPAAAHFHLGDQQQFLSGHTLPADPGTACAARSRCASRRSG